MKFTRSDFYTVVGIAAFTVAVTLSRAPSAPQTYPWVLVAVIWNAPEDQFVSVEIRGRYRTAGGCLAHGHPSELVTEGGVTSVREFICTPNVKDLVKLERQH